MRSIRLSLMGYFLGLLVVALGFASVLVYQTVQQSLRDKEAAARKLIQARHDERTREARARLDEALLTQAQTIARRVQIRMQWNRFQHRDFHSLGLLTALPSANAYALAPLWLIQGFRDYNPNAPDRPSGRDFFSRPFSPLAFEIFRSNIAELSLVNLPESDVVLPAEGQPGEFFQVDSNGWGPSLRSASLGRRAFPDTKEFARGQVLFSEPDDVELGEGKRLRRVRLRTASVRRVSTWGMPPPKGSKGPRPTGPRRDPPPVEIVVQVASATDLLDRTLAGLAQERDQELAELSEETAKALARQRQRLLLITGLTFAATVLGSFLLVWMGLSPLARLSDAVSKVSPKNFRLNVGGDALPAELRPIADRLSTTLQMLERAFAREKQATADISHELRTPLAALLTTIDLALRKPRPPEKYRELLGECKQSASHMHQIVERLLTLARLDAGVDRLRPQPVDVASIAEQCATVVRPLAEARGLRLSVYDRSRAADTSHGEPGALLTDPDKLREVLNNLLHNAVQYNRPDGRIDLTVARENGHVRFEVSDSGIGIPAEAREHIFERFYRADPSRAADDMHAGLGLAIVKEYVDLMGGRITVESQEGRGSTFRIELPVHGPAQAG